MRRVWLGLALSLSVPLEAAPPAAAAPPARPPVEAFATEPMLRGLQMSPDGKRVLGSALNNDRRVPSVYTFGEKGVRAFGLPEGAELRWMRWAGSNRFLASIARETFVFEQKVKATQLVAVDLATGESRYIGLRNQALQGDDVLWIDPEGASLLLSVRRSIWDLPAVWRADLATGKMTSVLTERKGVYDWYADSAGVVRAGLSYTSGVMSLWYRSDGTGDFRKVDKVRLGKDVRADELIGQLTFAPDSDEGYVLADDDAGKRAVYRYNFATRTRGALFYAAPAHDVSEFQMTPDLRSIEAVSFTDDRPRTVWFDAKLKEHQANIDKATPGRQAEIVSRSRDGSRMLVYLGASNNPGSYYVYDVASGAMQRLLQVNPALKPADLAEMKPVSYAARDGTTIPGYLTLPRGREAKNLPLIILPHGGPYDVRDTLSYNEEVQFLASRGYAVLQPNFRGSGGYGQAFADKGAGQFGRTMQDDLDDGMDWLVKQGIVDPRRVCLAGISYGGYAALWGATRNPERYRCAVSFAGISDVRKILSYSSDFFITQRYARRFKDRVKGEQEFDLATISPMQQIARLTVPLLILHGEDDQVVPLSQSADYVQALKRAGKVHEYVSYKKEGHGPSTIANRKDWLTRLEAFLAKYNPA